MMASCISLASAAPPSALAPLRPRVLSLFRRIMRTARTWESSDPKETAADRDYITQEARRLFRENRYIESPTQIEEHLQEGEARLDLALHYRNPYPRPVNLPPRVNLTPPGRKQYKADQALMKGSQPIYTKSILHMTSGSNPPSTKEEGKKNGGEKG